MRVYERHNHKSLKKKTKRELKMENLFGFALIFTKQHPWGNTLFKSATYSNDEETHSTCIWCTMKILDPSK